MITYEAKTVLFPPFNPTYSYHVMCPPYIHGSPNYIVFVDTSCEYPCTYSIIDKLFCKPAYLLVTNALASTTGMEYGWRRMARMHGSGVPSILGNIDLGPSGIQGLTS